LVFLACIPGLFVGALVAGKRSYALIATTVGILPIMGYFAYAIANPTAQTLFVDSTILIIVLMIEQFLAISILCSMLGGSIVERRRLFPFAKGIERAEGINYFDKEPEVEELTLSQQLTQEPYPQAEIPQPETYQPEGYNTPEEEQPPAEQEKQQDNWDQL